MIRESTIWYPPSLRARWPEPLAREWFHAFPEIFDTQDLAQTRSQRNKHFCEWLCAVHLRLREGAISLIEKYGYRNHPRQVARLTEILGERAEFVRNMRRAYGVQPPDLFVYMPDRSRFWFVEAKGPKDKVRLQQARSYRLIASHLGADVEVVTLRSAQAYEAR